MTTNNPPAHGPVSLDRLRQISEILRKAAAQSDGGNLGYAMADAVKVIDGAIAAFDEGDNPRPAMAVKGELGFIDRLEKIIEERDKDIDIGQLGSSNYDALMLAALDAFRASPPAVPNAMSPVVEVGEIIAYERHGERFSTIVGATWNACRAAMLQAGNSPVTPDGLVSCGENCWSCGKYFTYEQHSECDGYCPHCDSPVDLDDEEDEQSKAVPAKPTEDMISNAWRESLGKCDHETIRRMYVAMLAAAPQQEVKS